MNPFRYLFPLGEADEYRTLLVGETSRSRFFLSVRRPCLDASDVRVGETSRSRFLPPAIVCNRWITNSSGAGAPEL